MARKKPSWMGSDFDQHLKRKMADPAFRMEFAKARAARIKGALAEAIREARRRRGMTQTTLAKRAKTTQAVISRIENPGISYLPSVEVLSRLADAVGATLSIAFVPQKKRAA